MPPLPPLAPLPHIDIDAFLDDAKLGEKAREMGDKAREMSEKAREMADQLRAGFEGNWFNMSEQSGKMKELMEKSTEKLRELQDNGWTFAPPSAAGVAGGAP